MPSNNQYCAICERKVPGRRKHDFAEHIPYGLDLNRKPEPEVLPDRVKADYNALLTDIQQHLRVDAKGLYRKVLQFRGTQPGQLQGEKYLPSIAAYLNKEDASLSIPEWKLVTHHVSIVCFLAEAGKQFTDMVKEKYMYYDQPGPRVVRKPFGGPSVLRAHRQLMQTKAANFHPCTSSTPALSQRRRFDMLDSHCHIGRAVEKLRYTSAAHMAMSNEDIFLVSNEVDADFAQMDDILTDCPSNVRVTVGLHPARAHAFSSEKWNQIGSYGANTRVVGVGETGFDFKPGSYNPSFWLQQTVFLYHLNLSSCTGKPLVVHCRANGDYTLYRDLVGTLRSQSSHRLIHWHCWGDGSAALAEDLCAWGTVYFGIGTTLCGARGIAVQKQLRLQLVKGAISLDRCVLETDFPYLPAPGAKTLRENLEAVAKALWQAMAERSAIRGERELSLHEIKSITLKNSITLYNLDL